MQHVSGMTLAPLHLHEHLESRSFLFQFMHLLRLHSPMCTDGAQSSPFKLSVGLELSFYCFQAAPMTGAHRIQSWRLTHLSPPRNFAGLDHRDAAATAPAPLKAALLVMTTSTGYFHSMNCFHPEKGISIISSRGAYFFPYPNMQISFQSICPCTVR
jgi:hypothetical protein